MDLTRPVRRWRATGKPQRTELYFRWSMYLTQLIQPLVALSSFSGQHAARSHLLFPVGMAVSVTGTALSICTLRAALSHYLGRRGRPTGWLVATGLMLAAAVPALLLLAPAHRYEQIPSTTTAVAYLVGYGLGPAVIALSVRSGVLVCATGILLIAPVGYLTGCSLPAAIGVVIVTAFWTAFMSTAWRISAWVIGAVWELDAAREKQARLAVAEERLRFSRDLHDVMGRNLTTIALKSELAVQLARRGRAEAAEQMAEVQRIAQESQREVRDLVRGYRAADLQIELAGARSVLRAAQVECTTELAPETGTLPPTVQSVLGWVIREATTNVLRHSDARYCSIRLRPADGRAVLEIENDGVPVVPKPSAGSSTGLAGLRERLTALDGRLTCQQPGAGRYRLTASLPLTDSRTVTALEDSAR
ncbi:sensor histidine kinase [Kitasatospora sp. HPMI-4]|uniref:sensor histidine kinase n=1 Tax=Kitasatospora sp. HPMI-4 TaxID=3448443 RepID=UPI003F1C814B